LHYFECGRGSPNFAYSPGVASSSENEDEKSEFIWPEITPELVLDLSDWILSKLIDEQKFPQRDLNDNNNDRNDGQRHRPRNAFDNNPALALEIPIQGIASGPEGPSSDSVQIATDPAAVKMYVDEIFSLAEVEILQELLKVPLRRAPLDMLNKMQEVEIGSIIDLEFTVFPELLNVNLYLNIENSRDSNTQASNSRDANQLIIEAEHIHNKMIFDAANEALQKYRPYGLKGAPMPWSSLARWIGHTKPILTIIEEVKEELEDWSSIQAGKICTEDMAMSNGLIDDDLLQQIREERLANMLADEIIEKDEMWTNYEFEETQVKLDLSDMILEHLSSEVIEILG
jgi:hypothetical protein